MIWWFIYPPLALGVLLNFGWLLIPASRQLLARSPGRYYTRMAAQAVLLVWGDALIALSNTITLFARQGLGTRLLSFFWAALFILLTKRNSNQRAKYLGLAETHRVRLTKGVCR